MELARELANGPQVSMRLLKRSIYNAAELSFAHALDEIASKTAISDHHPDARGRHARLPGEAAGEIQRLAGEEAMKLAKQHLDVGLFTNNADAMLEFWQQRVGLPFEETLPLGGGVLQHRHAMNGSVLKLNAARDPLHEAPPSGYRELLIAARRPGAGDPHRPRRQPCDAGPARRTTASKASACAWPCAISPRSTRISAKRCRWRGSALRRIDAATR